MAVEVEDLYPNLNKLLTDICKFLTDETNYEKLSPSARKQADELLSRSKQQLQIIAKISLDPNESDGAYVDMETRPTVENNDDDRNEIYSSVDETPASLPPVKVEIRNPYSNLPAKQVSQDIKYGYLSWKCKIILKFEKNKRVYAGLHDNWLLVYSSEKDCKPLQTFDLRFHKAQTVSTKQNKNPPQDFELICTHGEKKTYHFLASTYKDMLQWTSHINRCFDNFNKQENLSISDDGISETYDCILEAPNNNTEDDENSIYHDIATVAFSQALPPALPARGFNIKPKVVLPPVPKPPESSNNSTTSSESSTYDAVQSRVSLESKGSFSEEDEEDEIYETFVELQEKQFLPNNPKIKRTPSISSKILEPPMTNEERPKVTVKPPILKEKPKFKK